MSSDVPHIRISFITFSANNIIADKWNIDNYRFDGRLTAHAES